MAEQPNTSKPIPLEMKRGIGSATTTSTTTGDQAGAVTGDAAPSKTQSSLPVDTAHGSENGTCKVVVELEHDTSSIAPADSPTSNSDFVFAVSPSHSPGLEPAVIRHRQFVLVLLVVLKLLTAYDSGAFSVVLGADDGLSAELSLSSAEAGTLGSSVFLGNLVGCVIAGSMFSQYSAKMVMLFGMLCHSLFTFLFGLSTSFEIAVIVRFLIGITLAFPVVYSPIWAEGFGPSDRVTTWMALCNAGVPIGTMIGFVIGGLVPANTSLDWRWVFFLKAIGMIPILAILHQIKADNFDVVGATKGAGLGGSSDSIKDAARNMGRMLLKFAKNVLYVSNVAALCSLYFVITALQTFITSYLRAAPFNADMNTIVLGFGATVVTAPVVGVIAGGIIIDRIGGYHKNLRTSMFLQLCWGTVAATLSIVLMFMTTIPAFLVVMWTLLCMGGAIVPVATGVLVAAVEEEHRSAASSLAAMSFNLLGYFAGPLFCGMIANATDSLSWGIRASLMMSFVGCIPMCVAAFASRRVKLPPASRAGEDSKSSSAFANVTHDGAETSRSTQSPTAPLRERDVSSDLSPAPSLLEATSNGVLSPVSFPELSDRRLPSAAANGNGGVGSGNGPLEGPAGKTHQA
jgi:MFS family permease